MFSTLSRTYHYTELNAEPCKVALKGDKNNFSLKNSFYYLFLFLCFFPCKNPLRSVFGCAEIGRKEGLKTMKDYQITKIWATTIADISEDIDSRKNWLNDQLEEQCTAYNEAEEDSRERKWAKENIDEINEKIKALEWILNTINAPFKISKK